MIFFFFFILIRTGGVVLFFYKQEWTAGITIGLVDLILFYAFGYNIGTWYKIKKLEKMVKSEMITPIQAKVISFSKSSQSGSNISYNIVFEYKGDKYQSAYEYGGNIKVALFDDEDSNNAVLTFFTALNIPGFPSNLQQTLQNLENFKTQEDIENYYSNKVSGFARESLANLDRLQKNKMSAFMHEGSKNMFKILSMEKKRIEERVKTGETSLEMSLFLSGSNISIKVGDYLLIYFNDKDVSNHKNNILPTPCLIDTTILEQKA